MSPLAKSQPIIAVHSLSKDAAVKIHVGERLFQRKKISTQLLDTLGRLELLLLKQSRPVQAQPSQRYQSSTQVTRPTHPEAERLLHGGLDALVRTLSEEGGSAIDYITKYGIAPLFPMTLKALGVTVEDENNDYRSHLNQMGIINELVSMAVQLQNDIKLTNHKYMAHQLALLYQCLNQAGSPFTKYKARVESMFDSVKGITTASKEEPQLQAEQKEWLAALTTEIVSEALFTGRTELFTSGSPALEKYLLSA